MGYELRRATMEAERNSAEDAYFEARPQIDCNDRRKVFDAGFERAWDAALAQAHFQKLGARLTELLDEDQWAECEALLLAAGVTPNVRRNRPAEAEGRSEPASAACRRSG